MYAIHQIASIIECRPRITDAMATIEHLLIDSRRLVFASTSLFFALQTERNNGAAFIDELYEKGVRNFVLHNEPAKQYDDVNILYVQNSLAALQQLAAFNRQQYQIPVIGITGSNGKTMVKEWLNNLLEPGYNIVRSPKSYNSQVGVPLSLWQMNATHTLGIFEAGISMPNEMEKLAEMIQPTIGVLTNIGDAHNEGFINATEKLGEKLKLFSKVKTLVYCKDCIDPLGAESVHLANALLANIKVFSWSTLTQADLVIQATNTENNLTKITAIITHTGKQVHITIPFTDKASLDNAITCWCVMLEMGIDQAEIEKRMLLLEPLDMRMQLKKGVNNCQLINDSYNNDLSSLELALDYLSQQSGGKKSTLILSDIFQSGMEVKDLCRLVNSKVKNRQVNRLILIGPVFFAHQQYFIPPLQAQGPQMQAEFYSSTDQFLKTSNTHQFNKEVILLKGARIFEFERIVHWLEEKVHQTVLEVNLDAMVFNLKQIQNSLQPGTRLMAMVKAFSYGSGSAEIAALLQFHKVDYLAVAYADEGVELRKAGISLPIMVMSPEVLTFDALVEYNLEPELYCFNILNAFSNYLSKQAILQYPVHIKIDTGMHRLGFELKDIPGLEVLLQQNKTFVVKSVFSHLACSDDAACDTFTQQQAIAFNEACASLEKALNYPFTRHLCNTAAIYRHPHLHYDMVRLGIGLYGIKHAGSSMQLQNVISLKTTIAQIKNVAAGHHVGYGQKGIIENDAVIATIRIGYADGFSRAFGNGVGHVFINGKFAPVVGNVCMDMTMVNITGIPNVTEGDVVEIFGENIAAMQLARWAATIPYEILTGISQRVKRVYYHG